MNANKFRIIIKERWKFYIMGYVIGYVAPIALEGAPSWHYFFPFRLMGIAGALGIGIAFYYGSKKLPIFQILSRSIKYAVLLVLIFIIAYILKEFVLGLTGYDITPLIGIPKPTK